MFVTGHLSAAYLLRVFPLRRGAPVSLGLSAGVVLGSLWPDLLDKSLMFAGWSPHGRTVGHALALWATLFLLLAALHVCGARWGPSVMFALGGAAHLVLDMLDHVLQGVFFTGYVFNAWFLWPWRTPDDWHVMMPPVLAGVDPFVTWLELLVIGFAAHVAWRRFGMKRRA
ncbi:MAG: hypothetical protein AAGI01_00265 [Myxococcota bacterium]